MQWADVLSLAPPACSFGAGFQRTALRPRQIKIVCHVRQQSYNPEANAALADPAGWKLFARNGHNIVRPAMLPVHGSINT